MNANDRAAEIGRKPVRLRPNRVWRTYSGGRLMEQWLGVPDPQDREYPEEWVASTVRANNPGRDDIVEGLSHFHLDDGQLSTLKEWIELEPEAMLGTQHANKYGANPAVLVKVLDACERLTIQVHPDPACARQFFHSPYGKTEAWYVLGGRSIGGEEPYVLFGFQEGITKQHWRELFETQNIHGMIEALHRIPLRPGDIFLVEGGVPHAIGAGCWVIEIQEPTDYTLRTERTTPSGKRIPDAACHQGIGFDLMLECFHYETYSYEQTLHKWKKSPRILYRTEGGTEWTLIGTEDTSRFSMHRLNVRTTFSTQARDHFRIAIVVRGTGVLRWSDNDLTIRSSDRLFIPAGVGTINWRNTGDEELEIVLCFPPE